MPSRSYFTQRIKKRINTHRCLCYREQRSSFSTHIMPTPESILFQHPSLPIPNASPFASTSSASPATHDFVPLQLLYVPPATWAINPCHFKFNSPQSIQFPLQANTSIISWKTRWTLPPTYFLYLQWIFPFYESKYPPQENCLLPVKYGRDMAITSPFHSNMDPNPQPHVLFVLTQDEHILIAHVNSILQVTHACGGQYKYVGHTISFPKDIRYIVTSFPHMHLDLNIFFVNIFSSDQKSYEFFVSRVWVEVSLQYKWTNDPYYNDVHLNPTALFALHIHPTYVSPLLHHVVTTLPKTQQCLLDANEFPILFPISTNLHPWSFISALPNSHIEVEEICAYLRSSHSNFTFSLEWPTIGLSPINEYNTKRIFSMAFPTLFPNGSTMINQPRLKETQMQYYALHLMHYHNNRFGKNPRFRYYLYNPMMCHHNQATTYIFIKKNQRQLANNYQRFVANNSINYLIQQL